MPYGGRNLNDWSMSRRVRLGLTQRYNSPEQPQRNYEFNRATNHNVKPYVAFLTDTPQNRWP